MTGFQRFTLIARFAFLAILSIPVLAGVVGVLFPAFGYFPALGSDRFNVNGFAQLFAFDGIASMIGLSLLTGLSATLLATLGALSLLAVFFQSRLMQKIQRLFSPLLVLPHAGVAIALLFILSPSGLVARLFDGLGPTSSSGITNINWFFPYDSYGLAITLALALKELPFILLIALGVLSQPQIARKVKGYYQSASALGYSSSTIFCKTVLPLLYPQIRLPLLAVLAFATANVEIPLLLGNNYPPTLSVAVVQWFNHVDLSMRFVGSAAAVIQLLVTVFALLGWYVLEQGVYRCRHAIYVSGEWQIRKGILKTFAYGLCCLYGAISLAVVYAVVVWSLAAHWTFPDLAPQAMTTLHWQTVWRDIMPALINTLLLGAMVSASALIMTVMTLESETVRTESRWLPMNNRLFIVVLFLPLLVPGVAFLYGLVWFQQRFFSQWVWGALFITHLVYVLPYVFISLSVAYRKLDPRYVKVAYGMGKTPWQVFKAVKLPMLFSPLFVAFALGVAISFSQYLPTLLSTGGRIPTITTEAVALATGSSYRLTAVYVVLQAILPLIGFVLAWWLPKRFFNPSIQPHVAIGSQVYDPKAG
jgi:putative thiamine transport system permease protein